MERDDVVGLDLSHVLGKAVAIGAGLAQRGADFGEVAAAFGNGGNEAVDFARCLGVAALDLCAIATGGGRRLGARPVVFGDVDADQFGIEHLFLQSADHAGLKPIDGDHPAIGAAAAVTFTAAAHLVRGHDAVAAAADAADYQPREKPLGPAMQNGFQGGDAFEAMCDGPP
ncbi:hypothetical protein WP12_16885 [Sphingomonas sp. SRS2]|nr:hypothetical protein WP12_16885 [Sphingomonas sp. SRS2]